MRPLVFLLTSPNGYFMKSLASVPSCGLCDKASVAERRQKPKMFMPVIHEGFLRPVIHQRTGVR